MMNKRLWMTPVLLALLAGCTINIQHPGTACVPCANPGGSGDPKLPKVLVTDGNITVDQEVLRFAKDQTDVTITWTLQQAKGGGRLSFPDNGVVFERAAAQEIVNCRRSEDGSSFSCLNRHSRPGVYRYGINVNEDGRPLKPLDPYVMND